MNFPLDFKGIDFKNMDLKDPAVQRTLIVLVLSLAIFAGYIYFMLLPQINRVTRLARDTNKMKVELKSAKSIIAERNGLKKKLDEYKEKVELYEKKLPAEQEIPSLLENLSNMAKAANIKITSIMPAVNEGKDQMQGQLYREIPIRITAKSGYHELGRFLSNLENADRFMKVTQIAIKSNDASPKMHDVDLTVCTYILLPEK